VTMMKICKSCDYSNDPGDVVCMGCGYPIGNDDGRFGDVDIEDDDDNDGGYFDMRGYCRPGLDIPDKEY
jgi:hypothetical protein